MILRFCVLALGLLSLGFGGFSLVQGSAGSWPPLVIGGLLVLGVVFERIVYKPVDRAPPGPDWRATEERFVDPASGATLTVFIKPSTGERRYVDDGARQPSPN
jgi:hypothetical protein